MRAQAACAAEGRCVTLRSYVCVCGHRLLEHALYRDPTPSAPNVYIWGRCLAGRCGCEAATNETRTIVEGR
jgi:hypothetical protein